MTAIDFATSRNLLKLATAEVKRRFPSVNLRSGCWTHQLRPWRDRWEFHGPDRFRCDVRASNGFEARYKGWMAWLRSKGVDLEEAA